MSTLLTSDHAVAGDLCDGFRRPDRAWSKGEVSIFQELGASLIFSNFWLVPKPISSAFSEGLARDFSAWSEDVAPQEEEHVLAVALWEGPADHDLVASFNLDDNLCLWGFEEGVCPEELPSLAGFVDQVRSLASDGDDNAPPDLLSTLGSNEGSALSPNDAKALLALVLSVCEPDVQDQVSEVAARHPKLFSAA